MMKTEMNLTPLLPMDRMNAALLAQTASHFESCLTLEKGGIVLNLKSMLGLLSRPSFGDGRVILVADGQDEEEAIKAILAITQN